MTDKVLENFCRRRAKRLGLVLRKSRARLPNVDNLGGYMLVDLYGNYVVAGARFDLNLADVVAELDEREQRIERV